MVTAAHFGKFMGMYELPQKRYSFLLSGKLNKYFFPVSSFSFPLSILCKFFKIMDENLRKTAGKNAFFILFFRKIWSGAEVDKTKMETWKREWFVHEKTFYKKWIVYLPKYKTGRMLKFYYNRNRPVIFQAYLARDLSIELPNITFCNLSTYMKVVYSADF